MADTRNHQLTQEDIDMLQNRRQLDAKFEGFMDSCQAQINTLDTAVANNTRLTDEVHTALFAKDANNKFEMPGLMVSMDKVLNHVKVMCNIAKFFKWLAVTGLATGLSVVAFFGDFKNLIIAFKALL